MYALYRDGVIVPGYGGIAGTGFGINFNIFSTPGIYTVMAYYPETGCFAWMNDSVEVVMDTKPIADAGPDQSITINNAVLLSGSVSGGSGGPYSFSWTPASMLAPGQSTFQNPLTVELISDQIFILTVTDASGCQSDTNQVRIHVLCGPLNLLSVTATPETVCYGDSVTLHVETVCGSGSSHYIYEWNTVPTSVVLGNNATITVLPDTNTTYSVIVTDTLPIPHVTVSGTVSVTVNPLPLPTLEGPDTLCNMSVNNIYTTTSGMTNYSWAVTGGIISGGGTPSDHTISVNWNTVGNQSVSVSYTSPDGCSAANPAVQPVFIVPLGQVNDPADQVKCDGIQTVPVNFSTINNGGTTLFTWTNNLPDIGLASSGSGNIPSFTAHNSGVYPKVATITVTPHFYYLGVGCSGPPQTFTYTVDPLPIGVSNPSSQTVVSGIYIYIHFSTSNYQPGTTYAWTRDNNINVTGIAASGTGNVMGTVTNTSGTVQTVTFTISPSSGGCAGNIFTATVIVYPAINLQNSSVQGQLTYDNALFTPLNNCLVGLTDNLGMNYQATSDGGGIYSFDSLWAMPYSLDVQCSKPWGGANAVDALLIIKHFVGISPLSGIRLKAADVDGSGFCNASDGLLVLKRFVGMQDTFPAGDWAFESSTITTIANDTVYQDIKGLCTGDVDGSYTPTARMMTSLELLQSGIILPGKTKAIGIPVYLRNQADVAAISLVFTIDIAQFRVSGVNSDFSNLLFHQSEGQLRIAAYSLDPYHYDDHAKLITLWIEPQSEQALDRLSDGLWLGLGNESQLADGNGIQVDGNALIIPKVLSLSQGCYLGQNVPNPFSQSSAISYYLPEDGTVSLKVYDMLGREVLTMVDAFQSQGFYTVTIERKNLLAGEYTYRLELQGRNRFYVKSLRMVVQH